MAKAAKRIRKKNDQVTDRSLWYIDLTSLDPSKKNEVWAAQALFFMKRSGGSHVFLDPKKAKAYRDTDQLKVDPSFYKQLVDPVTPMGGGGTAEHFSADWLANPIYIHLKNIVKAEIEKTPKQLEVDMTDKFAKTRQMRENYKIIYQRAFRLLINELAEDIGMPGIRDDQDPYKWVENLMKPDAENQQPDMINKFSDLIKNNITDSQDLALYNEFIYKGDYELAFELAVQYYLLGLNKWKERWEDEFINDIMHFNKAAGEYYTDLITGRPIVERFVPESLHTSIYKRKDGEDITYYWIEYDISFGDFMREMGKNLSTEKLKEVFTLAKMQGFHAVDWRDGFENPDAVNFARDSAMIRVGKAAFLSTDMEVQMEDVSLGYPVYSAVDLSWQPMNENQQRIEKRYNVWRWWYYIPPTIGHLTNANWAWQSNFIFNLQKFQDQERYGDNGRYAKPPLVIYDNSSQATFTDIVQAFMPKITHAWHKYQNCLVNDFEATIFSDDFIGGLMSAVDEDNKINYGDPNIPTGGNEKNSYLAQWRMIQQSGKGFLRMTDNKGQPMLDPSKMVLTIKNGFLGKAEQYLGQMMQLYDLMIKSLAFSPMSAGEEVKPRTPVAALEQSIKATDSSRFFIQKSYEDFYKQYGERIVRYVLSIFREKDKYGFPDRYDEFMENIGYANGLALEGMADIDPECVGMTVNYVDSTSKKEFIMQLALQYVKTKELSEDFLYLIMATDNWKYSYVLMRMAIKQRKKEIADQQAQAQQHEMEMKQMDMQIAMELGKANSANKQQETVVAGQVKDRVNQSLNDAKFQAQSRLKQQTGVLKMEENAQQLQIEKELVDEQKKLNQAAPLAVVP